MERLIEQVASNIHKRVIVDPRAASRVVLYGQKLDQITYPDFLTILRINGFTAVEVNDYINVVPIATVRSLPLPTLEPDRPLPDDQFATMSVRLKNACATSLIPLLRPIFPQYGLLVADAESNTLLAVDTFANLKRVRSIIMQLDASTKPGNSCEVRHALGSRSSSPAGKEMSGPALQPVAPAPVGELDALRFVPNMSCGQVYSPNWNNCVGSLTYPNGNIYIGEYHHGRREGFGVIYINAKGISNETNILSNEPSIYIGGFRGDRLNGHGVWFTKSGAGYSGTFVDNIPQSDVTQRNCSGRLSAAWNNCVAEISYGNGNTYRGEFVLGHREGIGMLDIRATGASDDRDIRMPARSVYAGEFRGDRLNGRGMVFTPSGGFYGTFADTVLTVKGAATTD
jgi:hypothetical protein